MAASKPKKQSKAKPSHDQAESVRAFFDDFEGLEHLRARQRGDVIVVESGPANDPIPHARLRRLSPQSWALDMATHTARWQPTPDRGPLLALLKCLVDEYPWILAPRE